MRALILMLLVLTGCAPLTEKQIEEREYTWSEACAQFQRQIELCNEAGGHLEYSPHGYITRAGQCPRYVTDMKMAKCVIGGWR